ncbi:MAG: phage holin family protein [Flammeovirgaceae bacterium]|nr:phage holin family protein [Flammeovirgaceae bacterium]MDW8287752.1 phage holin family protein [Flammeovirgaceae bacterium]
MQEKESPKPLSHASFERLIENFSKLVETYLKIIQLELKSGLSDALTLLIVLFVVSMLATFSLLFLSIGVAVLISDLLGGSKAWGFLIVAFFYVVSFMLMIYKKEVIRRKVQEGINTLGQQES